MAKKDNRFLFLLISLGILILVSPFFVRTPFLNLVLNIIVTLILIASVFEVRHETKKRLFTVCLLAVLSIIAHVAFIITDSMMANVVDSLVSMLFLAYISIIILEHIIRDSHITASTIFGAICIYILLGIFFMEIYSIIVSFNPQAITTLSSSAIHFVTDRFTLATMSYALLTTVGHADILVISPFAKSVVIIEQLTGVLYLATLVARLVVGLSIKSKAKK